MMRVSKMIDFARSVLTVGMLSPALCAAEAATVTSQPTQTVELVFAGQVGREPVACNKSFAGMGKTKASIFIQDFRVYLSAVRLISRNGVEVPVSLSPDGVWQDEHVALLDFEDATGNCNGNAATNDRIRGSVPVGDYRGVVFEIGVPFAVNHQDPTLAPAPLNYSALTWPWRMGYKFVTIDLDTSPTLDLPRSGTDGHDFDDFATGFSIHLGSIDCASSGPRIAPVAPCASPNRPTYRFESFDPGKQRLVLDLAALLAGTDVTVNMPQSGSGCMSGTKDDDCTEIMDRFGLTFRGNPTRGQQFVRAEAK
jgi:uncharacterized repeat protein (TIGR04052 family)